MRIEHPADESDDGLLRLDFDRRLKLEFHRCRITSDAGLLAYRELDDALGLTDVAGSVLPKCRRGKNTRHMLTSQMGRFETAWLTGEANLAAPADLSGAWIDQAHSRRPQITVVLDMESSVSETPGAQEGSACNRHFACTCYQSERRSSSMLIPAPAAEHHG